MSTATFQTEKPVSERTPFLSARTVPLLLLGTAVILVLPHVLDDWLFLGRSFTEEQMLGVTLSAVNLALVAAVGAIALNLLVGRTGLFSVGHAAFFMVGAATSAVVTTTWGLPFLVSLIASGITGLIVGVLVGLTSLRLSGLYLMLATLALHYIALYLFTRFQLANFGPAGMPFERPDIFGWVIDTDVKWYYLLVVIVSVVLLGVSHLNKSRIGRAFMAVKDNAVAAAAMGINVPRTRLLSFGLSAMLVSAAGCLYAFVIGHVSDVSFTLVFVIGYYAMIILGGLGSMGGAVLGALVWTLLPSTLNMLAGHVNPDTPLVGDAISNYQSQTASILMGLTIILILRFQPLGLKGLWDSLLRRVGQWRKSR